MDSWTIEENARIGREKPEKRKDCVAAMLYACQRNELDTVSYYMNVKEQICGFVGDDKQDNVLCNMICNMIEDSNNRAASFAKAAALLSGHKQPTPKEYDKAVKNE